MVYSHHRYEPEKDIDMIKLLSEFFGRIALKISMPTEVDYMVQCMIFEMNIFMKNLKLK